MRKRARDPNVSPDDLLEMPANEMRAALENPSLPLLFLESPELMMRMEADDHWNQQLSNIDQGMCIIDSLDAIQVAECVSAIVKVAEFAYSKKLPLNIRRSLVGRGGVAARRDLQSRVMHIACAELDAPLAKLRLQVLLEALSGTESYAIMEAEMRKVRGF
jgi:hypothetical protein